MLPVAAKLTQIDAKIDRFMTPRNPVHVFHGESQSIQSLQDLARPSYLVSILCQTLIDQVDEVVWVTNCSLLYGRH